MTDDPASPAAEHVAGTERGPGTQPSEPQAGGAGRLNWLQAGVLGADDGIVSVAGIVIGVAGATASRGGRCCRWWRSCSRQLPGGFGLALTYGMGHLFGTAVS
jgi:hypothetical protein